MAAVPGFSWALVSSVLCVQHSLASTQRMFAGDCVVLWQNPTFAAELSPAAGAPGLASSPLLGKPSETGLLEPRLPRA